MDATPRHQLIRRLLLSVPNRRLIYERIVLEPGIHLRGLARKLKLAVASVEHHVRQLEKHGLTFCLTEGRRRSHFASDHVGQEDARLVHAIGDALRRRLVADLVVNGPSEVHRIAQRQEVAIATASFHLRRLANEGILENIRAGRSSLYAAHQPERLRAWLPPRLLMELRPEDAFEGLVARSDRTDRTAQAIVQEARTLRPAPRRLRPPTH
jgi:transposase